MSGPSEEGVANSSNPATPATAAIPAGSATAAAPAAPASTAVPAAPAAKPPSFFDRYKIAFIVGLAILAAIAVGFGLGRIGRHSDKRKTDWSCMGMSICAK